MNFYSRAIFSSYHYAPPARCTGTAMFKVDGLSLHQVYNYLAKGLRRLTDLVDVVKLKKGERC